jgi:hypothetical protein
MALYGEFKPRKAKFGFNTYISERDIAKKVVFMNSVLGEPREGVWFLEMKAGMSALVELRIYIDDAQLAETFRKANSELVS